MYTLIISENETFTAVFQGNLGILSLFPLSYWVGLVLLIILSAELIVGYSEFNSLFYVIVLMIIGLYLFGFEVLIQKFPFESWTFPPFVVVRQLLTSGHIQPFSEANTMNYLNLPSYEIMNAEAISVLGIPITSLLTIMPVFWIFAFAIIAFGFSRSIGLSNRWSFLVGFLSTAGWNYSFAGYEYPRLMATLLLLMAFLIMMGNYGRRGDAILILIFLTVTLTHQLTALVLMSAIVLYFLYRRKYVRLIPFITIFSFWYVFEAGEYLSIAASELKSGPSGILSHLNNIVSGTGTFTTIIVRYTTLYVFAFFAVLVILTIASLKFNRFGNAIRQKSPIILLFLIASLADSAVYTSFEAPERMLEYNVMTLAIIFAYLMMNLPLRWKMLGLILVCSLALISPIVNYGSSPYVYFGPETALVHFYSVHQTGNNFYYLYDEGDMYLYNASFNALNVGRWGFSVPFNYTGMSLTPVVITSYLSTGVQGEPYISWSTTNAGILTDLVYDNGYAQVHFNQNLPCAEYAQSCEDR